MPETFTPPKSTAPKSITPVKEYSEAPKEILERGDFNIDASVIKDDNDPQSVTLETKAGEIKPLVKTEEPVIKEEPKLPSVLKAPASGEKPKPEEKKGDSLKINLPSKEKVQRDYSGYSADEVTHLKQMSDGAYKYVTDMLKQKKELEKNKDGSFLQHPEAYTLTPEYKQIQQSVRLAKGEGQYWQECLMACKKGESFKPIIGWNQQTGEPVLGVEVQPNELIEEQVRVNMNKCMTVAEQQQNALAQKSTTFQQRVQQDLAAVQNERVNRFQWVADPKLMDYTLNIEGVGDKSIKDIRQDVINLFPPYMRNSPATEVAADLMVALRIQHAELMEAKANQSLAEVKQHELQRAEPSSIVKPKAKADMTHGVSEFSLAGMEL